MKKDKHNYKWKNKTEQLRADEFRMAEAEGKTVKGKRQILLKKRKGQRSKKEKRARRKSKTNKCTCQKKRRVTM